MAGKKGRSGRPANETKLFSDEIINNVKTAAKKLEQEHNIPIEEAALSLIYDDKVQASVKSAIFKAYCDCFVEKSSKQKVEKEEPAYGPTIYKVINEDEPDIMRIVSRGSGGIWLPERDSDDENEDEK